MELVKLWRQPVQVENEVELLSHLHKPLMDEEKVPVSQKTFDKWLGNHSDRVSMQVDWSDLAAIWRVSSDERAPELKVLTLSSVISNLPPHHGTENTFIAFWQNLIGATLNTVQIGEFCRDSNKSTSTGLKRPDYSFCIKGHCVFRGEEKAPGSKKDPKAELLLKLLWTYDPLSFILGGS